jgi:hypothetical protein
MQSSILLPVLQFALWALLIARLVGAGLASGYRWFLLYLIEMESITLLAYATGVRSRAYCLIFWMSQPISLVLYIAMAREVVGNIYRVNPGLRWLARDVLWGLIGLSSIVGCVGIYGFQNAKSACGGLECEYVRFLQFQYFTMVGLIFFLLLVNWQLRRMARVHWNETVHAILLSFYFFMIVISHFLSYMLRGKHLDEVNVGVNLGNLLCLSLWLVLLRRTSPKEPPDSGARTPLHLMRSLRSYRAVLEESGRLFRMRTTQLRSPLTGENR